MKYFAAIPLVLLFLVLDIVCILFLCIPILLLLDENKPFPMSYAFASKLFFE